MENKLYELTNPQKSIWYTEEYYKGTPINNICCSVIIYEKVEIELLKKALFILIQTNDSFRIRLSNKADVPMQYISDFAPFEIEVSSAKDEEEFKSIENDFVKYTFNLYNENLFKFKIISFPDKSAGVILNVHHLISDSWSLGLTTQEILKIYHSILNNTITIQENNSYINYITKEQNYKTSQKYIADQTYWNTLFESVPDSVSIPSEKYQNDDSLIAEAKRLNFTINTNILKKIACFCKQNHFSQLDFFIAVFSVYIYNVCNSNDFVIGTPILNRTGLIEKNTTGMFVNTIPIRINFKNSVSFVDLAQSISKDMMSNLRHQKYSYNSILEDLRNKNGNIQPLYNIMLSYQITKAYNSAFGNYKTDWVFNNYTINDIAIHLLDTNNTGELNINYDYLTSKYNEQDIIELHNRIMHIIEQIIEKPNMNINQIEILTNEEKNKILYEFNNTSMPYPKDKTIMDLFEEQVEKNPDNIALIFENQKLTYKELNEEANNMANYLLSCNIKSSDVVAIFLNRSIDLIIAIWAVIKSGAIYTLIDPNFPKEHIQYILNNSGSKYCVVNNQLIETITVGNVITINIDNLDFQNHIDTINKKNISPSSELSIIYTSGSTGQPKGVLLSHQGFINLIYGFDKEMNISRYKNILGISTVSFDMFAVELFSSLLYGNTLVLANEEEQKNPNEMSKLITRYNIDFFVTTPTRVKLLLSSGHSDSLKNIKAFQLGGEKFTKNLFLKLKNYTNANIYNGYGPTEITACCTNKLLNPEQINIGKPIPNVQVYICNSNMMLAPIGVTGEICVTGLGLSSGYLNNQIETEKKFLKNPFGQGFLYKTGDYGKFLPNGDIEYIGRIDNQIKIRGLRVELEGLEEQILKLPSIESCIVIKKETNTREFLCAYFTSKEQIDSNKIRQYLKTRIPEYTIPQYFIQLDSLPYTNSGKIDRKKLPEINISYSSKISNPRNETDKELIDLLKSLLNVDKISIEDSFFEIGGDSLAAINLCIKIQHKFNINILVKEILEHPIVKDLSDIIDKSAKTIKNISIPQTLKADYYPISSAQKRIYFASNIAGNDSILYNTPGGIIFDNELDFSKLENSFATLINRQESLRTYFVTENNNVVQKIVDNIDFKLDMLDNVNFEEIDSIFKNFVKPFNLSQAPLFRVKYIKFTNKKSAIFIDMHHIISDGTSLTIFTDELIKLYNNEFLPMPQITYKDYAVYEKENLKNGSFSEAREYWLNQFKDEIPILNLPTSFARPSSQSFVGKKIHSVISKETTKKITTLCNSLNITPYMFLLACYYILLSRYTSQDDIVVGSPIVGRDLAETYNIIGMFVNTLALRNKIDLTCSFRNFILNIKENMLNAFKYQTYPFDELVKELNIARDTGRNPLFDTMFTYQNNGYKDISLKNIKANYYIPDTNISKFDISVEAVPQNDIINLTFEYATSLFTEEFIQNMSNHYLNILNNVLNDIDIKLTNIDILSHEEKNKILYNFNNTFTEYPKNKTIIDLFEEQVSKTPNNIAVVFENQKLTYKELNEKANSLAHYLRFNKNIKPNDFIGIMVNRSLEMIVSILAVLKSGGAYIPIDPTYPKDRISYMLKNSNTKILLTQEFLNGKIYFENTILVDLNNNPIYYSDSNNLQHINTLEDTSYVIFTSGSTGNPKGVVLNHKALSNLTNYCNNYIEYLKTPSNMAIVSITTVSFDIFIFETLIPLQKGLKLIIANENEKNSPYLLNSLIQKHNVQIIQSTPSRMQTFLNNKSDIPYLSNLKYITLAGEQLPLKLVQDLTNLCSATIYNGYGPSETTVFSTLTKMNTNKITIGTPLDNTQIYILDRYLNVLPIGISGEIYIAGDGVGKGYLNNKELTNKSFINNPFINNSIMYKTGDIGFFTKNGEIICLGRADSQVKLRGLRIELGEIESLIQEFPNIDRAIVIKNEIGNKDFLTCYFTANIKIDINNLKQYISNYLPKYMIPSYFIALEELPYTPNGKIDKKNLPLPQDFVFLNKKEYIAPETYLQKKLVGIFEEILNISPIGINDNFFELGGDSLLAMNLNMEIIKISNKITYQDIFNYPTVAEIEQKIISTDKHLMFKKIENLSEKHLFVLENTKKRCKINKYHPNDILLTGATGFLGIHILYELIENSSAKMYCIVRDSKNISAKDRLKQKLQYYFNDTFENLFDKRIFVISGDITKNNFGINTEELQNLSNSIDTVINSAAIVSHFGNFEKMYNANVTSVERIINFCKNYNKKLYHISTISVSGLDLDKEFLIYNRKSFYYNKKQKIKFDESNLYIGQNLENIYTRTKFEAENKLLEEISNGLDAYILRMGHLMPRYKDGIFQENILDNELINKMLTFINLGVIPDYLLNLPLEFTPIDDCAKAIYKIVTHPSKNNRIFHIYNPDLVKVSKILNLFSKFYKNLTILSEDEFIIKINQILKNETQKHILKNLLYDFDENYHLDYNKKFEISSQFTNKYLKRLRFLLA